MKPRLILVSLGLAVLAIVSLGIEAQEQPKGPAKDDVITSEQQLARLFGDFQDALLKLKQRLARGTPEERKRAEDLGKVLDECKNLAINQEFTKMIELLRMAKLDNTQNLKDLADQSENLTNRLRRILDMIQDSKADRLSQERKDLEQLLKDLGKVIGDQKTANALTDLNRTDKKELQNIQDNVNKATKKVEDGLGKYLDKDNKGQGAEAKKGNDKAGDVKDGQAGEAKNDGSKPSEGAKGETRDGGQKSEGNKGETKPGNKDGNNQKQGDNEPKSSSKSGEQGAKGDKEAGAKGEQSKDQKGQEGSSKGNPSDKGQKSGAEGAAKDSKGGDKAGDPSKSGEQGKAKSSDSKSGSESKGGPPDSSAKSGGGESGKQGPPMPADPKGGDAKDGGDAKAGGDAKGGMPGSQAGDSKAGDSKDGQGSAKGGGQGGGGGGDPKSGGGGQAKDSGGGSPPPPQGGNKQNDDVAKSKKQVQEAGYDQASASENIAKDKTPAASKNQADAIDKLEDAKKKLEKLLQQMREEEIERVLAALQARCEKMLMMQKQVLAGTIDLEAGINKNADKKPTRQNKAEALGLSDKEKEIVQEANKCIDILEAEGSAVAFPEVFQQIRQDMIHVQKRLELTDVADITQNLEKDIIATLEEMIDALKKARQDNQEGAGKPGKGGKGGQPGDQKLLELLQELKMVRSLQKRVNDRTTDWARRFPGQEQTQDPNIVRELRNLADRQQRIQEMVRKIHEGANK